MSKPNTAKARTVPSAPKAKKAVAKDHVESISHAALFRAIRESLGLTQSEAARRLGYTQTNVSKVEKKAAANLGQIGKLVGDDYEVIVTLRPRNARKTEELRFTVS